MYLVKLQNLQNSIHKITKQQKYCDCMYVCIIYFDQLCYILYMLLY